MNNYVKFYLKIVLYVNEKEQANVYSIRVLDFLFLSFYFLFFLFTSISCRLILVITDKIFSVLFVSDKRFLSVIEVLKEKIV